MTKYRFQLEFEVRDYECDLQGIVNHAVDLNYLEHSRHMFLKNIGLNFAELHQRGFDLVMIRCEPDFRYPLESGDQAKAGASFPERGPRLSRHSSSDSPTASPLQNISALDGSVVNWRPRDISPFCIVTGCRSSANAW